MADGDAEKAALIERLDDFSPRSIPFWWRDDDATTVTPALDVLLQIRARHDVPLALAVIPKHADEKLATCLSAASLVSVFQHGWQHKNHANKDAGERASEFGEGRPVGDSLSDLTSGFETLSRAFPGSFLPIFTPPWNRIGTAAEKRRREAGLVGLSAFGASKPDAHRVDAHVDVIDWKRGKVFVGRRRGFQKVIDAIDTLEPGDAIGLLTHHLDHDAATNAFMDELLTLLKSSKTVKWPDHKTLFRL
ncbi:MAG: polysaccharide deacetylase family protein [Pseudomonadota bacterium]